MTSRLKIFSLWLPVVLYAGLIFFLSSRPGKDAPHLFPHDDKVIHFFEYLPFGVLLARALGAAEKLKPAAVAAAVAFATLYALTDEIHQLFVPGRTFSVFDILADTGGSAAGAHLIRITLWPR